MILPPQPSIPFRNAAVLSGLCNTNRLYHTIFHRDMANGQQAISVAHFSSRGSDWAICLGLGTWRGGLKDTLRISEGSLHIVSTVTADSSLKHCAGAKIVVRGSVISPSNAGDLRRS